MASKNSLLWEISQDNHIKGYLFGTMHVSGKVAFSNFDLIYSLIDQCDCLATEISLDQETQKEMGRHTHMPDHTSLEELLSEKKYHKIEGLLLKHFGLDLEIFNNIMPLFLINIITQKSIFDDENLLNVSMDFECWKYAQSQGKELTSVESLEEHINTLYAIPLDYQIKALKDAMSNIPKFRKKAKKMIQVYKSQDIHKLYKESKKSIGDIKDVLLYDRNYIMADNIYRISQDIKTFFAFGAGHLSGKKGVIKLLKEKGLSVKPMSLSQDLIPFSK